ncbi:MAG: hypothetical protein AAF928_08740 [Myxococcota bacterium]
MRSRRGAGFGVALSLTACAAVLGACAWDGLDPRLGASASGGAGGATSAMGGAGPATGGAGGTGGAASTGVGAGGPTDCGRISMLADAFEASELDQAKWTEDTRGGLSEAMLVASGVRLTAGAGDRFDYGRLRSRHHHDMREGSVSVDIGDVSGLAPEALVNFVAYEAIDGARANFRYRAGALEARVVSNGQEEIIESVAYDTAMHRFWRLRHEAGLVHFDVSGDGATWTSLVSIEERFAHDFANARMEVLVGWATDFPMGTMPQTITIGPVVAEVASGAPDGDRWCKADTLTDAFEAPVRDAAWGRTTADSGAFIGQNDGEVFLGFNYDDTSTDGFYGSSRAYDLTDASVSVEMTRVAEGPGSTSVLRVDGTGPDDEIILGVVWPEAGDEAMLRCTWEAGSGVNDVCPGRAFDAVADRFFRLRVAAGALFWETSPDGVAFDEKGRLQMVPFDLTAVALRFGARANTQLVSPPPDVRFDNVNLLPAAP